MREIYLARETSCVKDTLRGRYLARDERCGRYTLRETPYGRDTLRGTHLARDAPCEGDALWERYPLEEIGFVENNTLQVKIVLVLNEVRYKVFSCPSIKYGSYGTVGI